MEKKKLVISLKSEILVREKKERKLLAKQFFPSFLLKMKYLISVIYKIHPRSSYMFTAKLLSVAGRKKLSTKAVAFYEKGTKRKINVEGATFYTYTYGNGPLILMLHGWCGNAARWRVYVNELVSSGYKVMVVDAPGHGTAPGRFLSIFLYAKGIKAILTSEKKWYGVITHSIAGLTAITAIGNSEKKYHPSKFIMMNTFANATTVLERFSGCLGIPEKVIIGTKELLSNYLDFPLKEYCICRQYNNINTKGLLIYDTNDRIVPQREAEYIIDTIKQLQTLKTEGLGHTLRSNDVVKAVIGFMKNEPLATVQLKPVVKKVAAYM